MIIKKLIIPLFAAVFLSGCGTVNKPTNSPITSDTTSNFGDGKQYTVSLFTTMETYPMSGSRIAYQDINLSVSGNGSVISVPLKTDGNTCIYPALFLGDFTGDGNDDIFIEIPTDSADGWSPTLGYIYTFYDGKLTEIFNSEYILNLFTYIVTHQDNYITQIYSNITGKYYYGDSASYYKNNPPHYDDENMNRLTIYDTDGKAADNIPHFDRSILFNYEVFNDVTFYGSINKTFGLCVTQSVFGTNMHDCVGGILSYLKWNDSSGKFIVTKQIYDSLH